MRNGVLFDERTGTGQERHNRDRGKILRDTSLALQYEIHNGISRF